MCSHFWQILREVQEIVENCKKRSQYQKCRFFFRGEYNRYPDGGDVPGPASECVPSLYREERYKHERTIFYDTIRHYPEVFRSDMTTFDMLATMQHYQALTRLLDITSDVRLATAMATAPFFDVKSEHNEHTAFVYVYAVKEDCIKIQTSAFVLSPPRFCCSDAGTRSVRSARVSANVILIVRRRRKGLREWGMSRLMAGGRMRSRKN
jgi:hypothetical protein